MTETWVPVPEFPTYAVSNEGRVMNVNTEILKIPSPNQQGIPSVLLIREGLQHRRAVAPMVAHAFLEAPARPAFDTPINLDGDRFNNRVDNLEWRPRWFAIKYHSQFKHDPPYGFDAPIELIETGEVFDNVRDCAMKYGLLMKEVILAAHNHIPVFPTWQEFQLVPQ